VIETLPLVTGDYVFSWRLLLLDSCDRLKATTVEAFLFMSQRNGRAITALPKE
jgi:hypothetical protein